MKPAGIENVPCIGNDGWDCYWKDRKISVSRIFQSENGKNYLNIEIKNREKTL